MFCGKCGHSVPETNNFCTRCGEPASQNFTVKEESDVAIIMANCDKLDYQNHGELTPIFNKIYKKRILLDMAKVEWIDSVGIGTIVTLSYKTARTKQDMKLINICQKVLSAIKALQVDNVLDICKDKDEAMGQWGLARR